MVLDLSFPDSEAPVESLALVIPVDDREAPLFHACTDGIRFNYAGKTPPGAGRVWDGRKAARNSILGSFVPYLWLGGPERGLAVFGENDRGWSTSPEAPCQELVRTPDGTLELRLNLFAQPVTSTKSRRITLGFQATPVKPMPESWRLWTIDRALPSGAAGAYRQTFLGSCYHWGALTPCRDLYPRDGDFSLYEKLSEARRGGSVDEAFVAKWLAGYRAPSAEEAAQYPRSIRYAMDALRSKPDGVLVYTNARGARFDTPEGKTFLDEWHRDAFPTRDWSYGTGVSYDADPVPSYQDYALWHYQKMLGTFADAIYWDDVFLQSNFDTVGTDAYDRADGLVQPSAGLFRMRELIRRTAVLGKESGKPNRNMAHMTNTAIAPILSFAATSLTWEDRAGDQPFQERFSRDYVQAESIGRQFGTVPFALGLVEGPDASRRKWAERTGSGVLLTHEIKTWAPWEDYGANFRRLVDFGYGGKDVKVWNYWQPDYPAKISGGETSSLLLSKSGAALFLICDYAEGGDRAVTFDAAALVMSGPLTARDLESGVSIPLDDRRMVLPLKKHDFRVILVEAK